MPDAEHVAIFKRGTDAWNKWRIENKGVRPNLNGADLCNVELPNADLSRADLSRADLRGADLRADLNRADLIGAHLIEANLSTANLEGANLSGANLQGANLSKAFLSKADLSGANLQGADLSKADLRGAALGSDLRRANLNDANLRGADLTAAFFHETLLANVDLSAAKGLGMVFHIGPSVIDHRTIEWSGILPPDFLRGIGLPDNLINTLPGLLNLSNRYYSCFISCSAKDNIFAERLCADLRHEGVQCWFAPHDLPIGAKTLDTIIEEISRRDKMLLILSKNSIASDWVEDEVTKAFAEERGRKKIVLIPIRLDDAVMETGESWAIKLRDNRNIGDFRRWKRRDVYAKALDRVLRDLAMDLGPAHMGE